MPDARLRGLFSLLLTDSGALVAACPDHDEVIRVLGTRFCRLCVLAQGSGEDLGGFIGVVRKVSPDTKILLIANREDVDAVLPLFSAGLDDALLQPINPKRAVAALQKLLGAGEADGPAADGRGASPIVADEAYRRPLHLVARAPAMRRAVNELWAARNDPVGVILRGEAGTEFELAAREYQTMGGDTRGFLVVLGPQELDVETLATQHSLDRLDDGVPRTYFVPEIERLGHAQARSLLEFLRRARRRRDKEKPLRMVFASHSTTEDGRAVDGGFLEELQFIVPALVNLPPLRERREDIEPLIRRTVHELTAIFPGCRVRSVHPGAMQWLRGRTWRGNHRELVAVLRKALLDCPSRELATAHFGKLTDEHLEPGEAAAAGAISATPHTASG